MGQFREVVAKAKRCIFLHIVNEKLILGPYEEVYFSVFFKKLLGYKRRYQNTIADLLHRRQEYLY